MTANNKDKRKRTKKSGVFKRLDKKWVRKFHLNLFRVLAYHPENNTVDIGLIDPKSNDVCSIVLKGVKTLSPHRFYFVVPEVGAEVILIVDSKDRCVAAQSLSQYGFERFWNIPEPITLDFTIEV